MEILLDQKPPPSSRTFGYVSGPSHPSGPAGRPRPNLGAIIRILNIDQNQACGCSTCRSQCPEHEDNFLFEIGLKLTELRGLTRCPYMGANGILGYYCAIKWPNFNIFQWNLFYMISTLKLHHIPKFQPSSC